MHTILVTGASGFVGSRFVHRWGGAYRLLTPTHSECDITDRDSVEAYFNENRPDAVLHLAAISNTAYCEEHPQESHLVNVQGAENVAIAAAVCGAKMVFFSSDQVYNGNAESGLLSEDVPLRPETIYASHKLKAEQLVAAACPDAVILRETWMYDADNGLPVHNNFVLNIQKAVAEKRLLSLPMREYRGITWVREVVELLPATFNLRGGVYNYGSENRLSTYETGCCFLEMLNANVKAETILQPDIERYPIHERNLSISTDKIIRASAYNICFCDTLGGFRMFLEQ